MVINDDAVLFDMAPSPRVGRPHINVLPCSVVEVEPERHRQRRVTGDHETASSREAFSHFPTAVGDLCLQLFLRHATCIYDPFAGWGERGSIVRQYGKQYVGIDCNPAAIAFAHTRYGIQNVLANALHVTLPTYDALLTCPPYWNLESYGGDGLDALPTWESFLDHLQIVLSRAYAAAASPSTFCILSGDWRREGVYYDLTFRINAIMSALGAVQVDSVIASRLNISKIKIMIPQAVRLGYTVKVHETLNVFKKNAV